MFRRRITTIPAALTVAALALTGCGSSDTAADTAADSASSSSSNSDAATESTQTAAAPLAAGDFGQRIVAAQQKAGSFKYSIETTVAGQKLSGQGEASISGDAPSSHATLGSGAAAIETISTDGIVYIKSAALGGDKPWLKIDPKADSDLGAMFGQPGGQDPSSLAKAFAKVASLKAGATEDVSGVEATKYTVTIASADLAQATGMSGALAGALPKELTYDIWVDAQDRPVKIENNQEVSGQSIGTTIAITDYGTDVSIEAPPAAQVTTTPPAGLGG